MADVRVRIHLVLLVLAVSACGSSSSSSSPVDAAADAPSLVDGAVTGDASVGPDARGASDYGDVAFMFNDMGSPSLDSTAATAAFGSGQNAQSFMACPPGAAVSGACCYFHDQERDGGGPLVSLSAGTLALSAAGTVFDTMTFDAAQQDYMQYEMTGTAWAAGTMLQVAATGGAVDAFTGSVAMPAPLAGLSVTAGGMVTWSRSADWTAHWTASGAAANVVLVAQDVVSAMKCVTTGSAGSLTVPAALLSMFSHSGGGGFYIGALTASTATAPNGAVEVSAANVVWASYALP
jgi:hypothetical protein